MVRPVNAGPLTWLGFRVLATDTWVSSFALLAYVSKTAWLSGTYFAIVESEAVLFPKGLN